MILYDVERVGSETRHYRRGALGTYAPDQSAAEELNHAVDGVGTDEPHRFSLELAAELGVSDERALAGHETAFGDGRKYAHHRKRLQVGLHRRYRIAVLFVAEAQFRYRAFKLRHSLYYTTPGRATQEKSGACGDFRPMQKRVFPEWKDPFRYSLYAGYTLTFFLVLSYLSNLTTPSAVAKSVSSLPMPTLVPGWNLVPR